MILLTIIILIQQFWMISTQCYSFSTNLRSFQLEKNEKIVCEIRNVYTMDNYEEYNLPETPFPRNPHSSELTIDIQDSSLPDFSASMFIPEKIACNFGKINLIVNNVHVSKIRPFPVEVRTNSTSTGCKMNYTSIKFNGNSIPNLDALTFNNLPSLKSIDLSNNSILNMDPLTFENTPLSELDLSQNKLSTIEKAFGKLDVLQSLDLSINMIGSLSISDFENITGLTKLDLSFNQIKNIKTGTFAKLKYLEELNLAHNYLSNIEMGTFSGLIKLISLTLRYNSITSTKALTINTPRLKHVDLSFNNMQNIDLQIFRDHRLSKIEIDGNNFTCQHLIQIIETFRDMYTMIEYGLETEKHNIYGMHCYEANNDTKNDETQEISSNTEIIKFFNHGFVNSSFYNFFTNYFANHNNQKINSNEEMTPMEVLKKIRDIIEIEQKAGDNDTDEKKLIAMINELLHEVKCNNKNGNYLQQNSAKNDTTNISSILIVIMCLNALTAFVLVAIVLIARRNYITSLPLRRFNANIDDSTSRNGLITDTL